MPEPHLHNGMRPFDSGDSPFAPKFRDTLNENFGRSVVGVKGGDPRVIVAQQNGIAIIKLELDDSSDSDGGVDGDSDVSCDGTDSVGSTGETEAAASDSWTRQGNSNGVALTQLTRMAYDDTVATPTLYAYYRDLTFDCEGKLSSVSAETRVTLDVPEAC